MFFISTTRKRQHRPPNEIGQTLTKQRHIARTWAGCRFGLRKGLRTRHPLHVVVLFTYVVMNLCRYYEIMYVFVMYFYYASIGYVRFVISVLCIHYVLIGYLVVMSYCSFMIDYSFMLLHVTSFMY